ncbi:MAG: glycosyltransferase, partial [Leptospira sp.]|nr:glycosyltransferase [Leptospira sp.]
MILHLNTSGTWRGGEQQLLYLALGLKKNNIRQVVAGQPGSELEKKCIESEIQFLAVRMRAEIDFFAVLQLRKFLSENPVKLIHVHTAKAHSIALLVKLKFPDVRLFVSRRVDFHINKNPLSKLKYFSEKNDLFLTVSERIKEVLIEDGIDAEKIVTVYSGIDLSRFRKLPSSAGLRKEFGIDPKTILIGNVA